MTFKSILSYFLSAVCIFKYFQKNLEITHFSKPEKDRRRYLQWSYQARKRYELKIPNYMITSTYSLSMTGAGTSFQIPLNLVAG